VSFCRIYDKEIRQREPILELDGLIVQDPTLFKAIDVFQGLKPDGYLLVNTNKDLDQLHLPAEAARLADGHARVLAASELALKHIGRPVPNAALLGAFAALTGIVHLHSVATAIREAFPGKVGEANVAAAIRSKDRARWRRGSPFAGPKSSAPIRSPRRPTL
jgi:pyruvate ferredoxin oxidoreductase gamma subunit